MANRKLLLVSYLFPPAGGIAVQRALSLAKYLPQNGFEVHILKARNAAVPVMDPGLLRQVPSSVQVHEAFTPEIPFQVRHKIWQLLGRRGGTAPAGQTHKQSLVRRLIQHVLCPEPEVLWAPFAVRVARKVVRRHAIDAVMITAPPFSAFLVGNALKREFPHLKLISDFRDEWLDFYLKDFEFQSGERTRRCAAEIERETVTLSDLIVAVTPSTLETMRRRYPELPEKKWACVANGYDPEAFSGFQARRHNGDRMVVTHVGTAYKTASPRYYLDALDALPEEIRSRIETRFVGRVSAGEERVLESRRSPVKILGFMPQVQALRQIEETDYLLLTMTNDISLPGKLFEYLATGKPILALTPGHGEVARILRETGAGESVEHDDPAAIRRMLEAAWQRARSGDPPPEGNREAVRGYERPRLTAEYAQRIRTLWE